VNDAPSRVLVVEDDDAIALVLEDLLAGEGFDVQRAPDGAVALSMLELFRPNVILLDLMMPVMDGWTFRVRQRSLEETLAAIPVVVLSGARGAVAAGAELEAAAVVIKPFALDTLIEAVRGLV
jgi:two-component system chemotaxis response regulator CheY